VRISLVNLLNLEIDSRKFGAFAIGEQANSLRFGFFYQQDGDRGWTLQLLPRIGKVLTFLAMAEPHNLGLQLPIPLVLSQYYELRVLFPYTRLIPIFAGDNCQMCPCYIMLSRLNQACFLKNNLLLWCSFPTCCRSLWFRCLELPSSHSWSLGSTVGIYPNKSSRPRRSPMLTDIISHVCHMFDSSLIQIHRDSLHVSIIFTIGSMMSHFLPRCTLY